MFKPGYIVLVTLISICLYAGVSDALIDDKKHGKYKLIGKFKPQATFRTEDAPDNNPIPIEAGDMTSQRNLLMVEFKHDLGDIYNTLSMEYYLHVRGFYDSAWDYGSDALSDDDVRDAYLFDNRDQIENLQSDIDLFMAYFDLTWGSFFMRAGRQVMAWGEMSTIRILDGTNPMDTSSLAVDILERLIPLDMVRANLAFDFVGPFDSLSIEGYYVPGKIDSTYEKELIDGSPVHPTVGRDLKSDLDDTSEILNMTKFKQIITQVDSDIDSDRYGIKLGLMLGSLEINFAYYRMYSDIPVASVNVDSLSDNIQIDMQNLDFTNLMDSVLGDEKLEVVLEREDVNVYGSSFNYHWDLIDTVIRGEVAIYKDQPKMTPGDINGLIKAFAPKIDMEGLGTIDELIESIGGIEGFGALPFTADEIATYDIWKYGIGFDKWLKIPFLNSEDFMFTFEYVGTKTVDWEDRTIMQAWTEPWDDDRDGNYDVVWEEEYSNTFVFITNTYYMHGNLTPQLVAMYEVEPIAIVLIPSLRYQWRDFQFDLSYFYTESYEYKGTLGMLDLRDEITISFTYNF